MELGLERPVGEKVVAAYLAARKSERKARFERFGEGGGRGEYQASAELGREERGKLDVALKEILDEEKTAKVLTHLGTFSRTWDAMMNALLKFELEREKRRPVMKLMTTYIGECGKAAEEGRGDWRGVRDARKAAKEKVDKALEEHLTAEQLAKYKEATASRRR